MSASSLLGPADSGERDATSIPETAPAPLSLSDDPATLLAAKPEALFEEALAACRHRLTRADRILVLIQEGQCLEVKASYGSKAVYIVTSESVSRSILRRVRRTQRAILIQDALSDRELAAQSSVKAIGQRGVVCAPIQRAGERMGVVYADSISLVNAFSEEEFRWTIRLANSLARRLHELKTEKTRSLPPPIVVKPEPAPTSSPSPPLRLADLPGTGPVAPELPVRKLPGRARPKLAEQAVFFRSLACLLSSGVTLLGALNTLSEADSPMSPVAGHLAVDLNLGIPLSSAMSRFPHLFSLDVRSLVAVGEKGGSLDTTMDMIAREVEKQWALWEKVKGALTYPVIIALFCLAGVALAPPLFLNDFFENLQSSQVQLPLLSRWIMNISNAVTSPFTPPALVLVAVFTTQLWKWMQRSERARREGEKLLLSTPVVGEVYSNLRSLQFYRALGLQLEAGLYLDRSLKLSAQVCGSPGFQEEIGAAVERIKAGETLSFSLLRSGLFPRLSVEFIKVGEETGKVPEMCRAVERLLTQETEHAIEVGQAFIEPVTMAVLGIVTGLIAIGCLLPLIRMIQNVL